MTDIPPTEGLTLEVPEEVTIDLVVKARTRGAFWSKGALRLHTPGFTVVGTSKTLATYKLLLKRERWGVAHIPSGYAIFARFRIREEAEDFASWMYLNAVNRNALANANHCEVSDALGQRVRSRILDGKVLTPGPAAKNRALDTYKGKTETEILLEQRATAFCIAVTTTNKLYHDRIAAIAEKERLIIARENEIAPRAKILAESEAEQLVRVQRLAESEILSMERERQLNIRENDTATVGYGLQQLRTRIVNALTLITDNVDLTVTRELRGVRIRGVILDDNNNPVIPVTDPEANTNAAAHTELDF